MTHIPASSVSSVVVLAHERIDDNLCLRNLTIYNVQGPTLPEGGSPSGLLHDDFKIVTRCPRVSP